MDETVLQQNEDQESQVQDDPWALAFAALDKSNEEVSKATPDPIGDPGNGQSEDSSSSSESIDSNDTESKDSAEDQGTDGGMVVHSDEDSEQSGNDNSDMLGISDEELEQYRSGYTEEIRDRAINEVAQEFIKRGIKHKNGKLGATLDDPDICKYDDDKIPHFYNPDTGREFTGDNPRRQAQEWIEDYNKELAEVFNAACREHVSQLMKEVEPQIQVLEFASTYDGLDPIRKSMFDSLIESYEIKDSDGSVIGYSCDLNQALSSVDRMVQSIQAFGKANSAPQPSTDEGGAAASPSSSSGPVLDMKNSSGAIQQQGHSPKSLAEAIEIQQNKLLEELKQKGNK